MHLDDTIQFQSTRYSFSVRAGDGSEGARLDEWQRIGQLRQKYRLEDCFQARLVLVDRLLVLLCKV